MRSLLAACGIAVSLSFGLPAEASGDDTAIIMEGHTGGMVMNGGAGCGCQNVQRPPWHGNVSGSACGPACVPGYGSKFHANPWGQLHLRRYAREHCMTLPPCFPRLHGWMADGQMPSPEPPALPRCHQCGAVIDGGF